MRDFSEVLALCENHLAGVCVATVVPMDIFCVVSVGECNEIYACIAADLEGGWGVEGEGALVISYLYWVSSRWRIMREGRNPHRNAFDAFVRRRNRNILRVFFIKR